MFERHSRLDIIEDQNNLPILAHLEIPSTAAVVIVDEYEMMPKVVTPRMYPMNELHHASRRNLR